MNAEPLRYPPGDAAHRPHRHDLGKAIGPQMQDFLIVDGCGYSSPELMRLVDYYGEETVRKACAALAVRPIRQNVEKIKEWLEVLL